MGSPHNYYILLNSFTYENQIWHIEYLLFKHYFLIGDACSKYYSSWIFNFVKKKQKLEHDSFHLKNVLTFYYEKMYITYMMFFFLVIFMNEDNIGMYTIKANWWPKNPEQNTLPSTGRQHTLTKRAHCTLGEKKRARPSSGSVYPKRTLSKWFKVNIIK